MGSILLVKDKIRIASGQGFWGDLQSIPLRQATKGPIDYLMMDFLAEVAMSMLTTGIDSLTAHEMKKENK